MTLNARYIKNAYPKFILTLCLQELFVQLDSFDKRTIEQALIHMKSQSILPHLADLAVVDVLETHGRERRYRYFTSASYSQLLAHEGMDANLNSKTPQDPSAVGGFMLVEGVEFFKDLNELNTYLEGWGRGDDIILGTRIIKAAKPRGSVGAKISLLPKQGKKKKYVNPLLPDGTRKKGRPRKSRERRQIATASRYGIPGT